MIQLIDCKLYYITQLIYPALCDHLPNEVFTATVSFTSNKYVAKASSAHVINSGKDTIDRIQEIN